MKLEVLEFIKTHRDWEDLLSSPPYCIDVSRDIVHDRKLVMLKYKQFEGSDFNEVMVRECRGLIFDEDTYEPVSVPFFKFGNYGESWVKPENLDWDSARVYEKIDGSLIKLTILDNGKYLISTNGTIDAFKAPIGTVGCPFKSFGDLVVDIISSKFGSMENFIEKFKYFYKDTLMFELTSPWNIVVVPHKESKLWVIGGRELGIGSLGEYSIECLQSAFEYKFPAPKSYPIKNLPDLIELARTLPWIDEGFVVVDKDEQRIKVKSPEYLKAHHIRGEGVLGKDRAIEIVLENEIEEVCTYFPQYLEPLMKIKENLSKLESDLSQIKSEVTSGIYPTRKDLALKVKGYPGIIFGFAFQCYGKPDTDIWDFIIKQPRSNLYQYLLK